MGRKARVSCLEVVLCHVLWMVLLLMPAIGRVFWFFGSFGLILRRRGNLKFPQTAPLNVPDQNCDRVRRKLAPTPME
ncbi:hypothetical protein A2U01_0079454 [Trifolium medium]|uniref:Uncharacterized protein n=1 Tax=Trifolium medium TaxID=97028 RepID=A0A392TDA0_9FABA|nr:hypothetical protein [Trifolium medium]